MSNCTSTLHAYFAGKEELERYLSDILDEQIGECKWTNCEDARRLLSRLHTISSVLPFVRHQEVHIVLFTKTCPVHNGEVVTFLPDDVLRGLS